MGVPIQTRMWRLIKRAWKKSARKRARRRAAVQRSAKQRAAQAAKAAARPVGPATARPRPAGARPTVARPAAPTPPAPRPAPEAAAADATPDAPVGPVEPAAHPLNLRRRWQRREARALAGRLASVAESNDLAVRRQATLDDLAAQKVEARRLREERRERRREAAAAKLAAAQARSTRTQETPTVIPPRKGLPAPAVMKRRPIAPTPPVAALPATALCGAPTDAGGSCTHPVAGDRCAAGHTPTSKPTILVQQSRAVRRPGETTEQFVGRGRSEATARGRSSAAAERAQTRNRA